MPNLNRSDTTWRLCTRGITPERAAGRARIDGDPHLAAAALHIVSIIWRDPSSSLNPRPQAFGWRAQLTISLGNQ
jgi:ABC-type dipeptide/oligopeptide/nickel transport system ATPase subunit